MQLSQSEALGVIDKNSVGIEEIDSVFYDGGGQKNVVLAVLEVDDGIFQLNPREASMGNGNPDMFAKYARQLLPERLD